MARLGRNEKLMVWIGTWALTRIFIVVRAGFWNHVNGINYEDVNAFAYWAHVIAKFHMLPTETEWQYPPGAAFLMLIPRLGGGNYGIEFVVMMLIVDLVGLGLVVGLQRRGGSERGVWVWLLAMPILTTWPILRFDMVPTVIAMAALVVLAVRPLWLGALAGLGATVKVWPIFVLFAEWDRRRLLRSAAAAAATIVVVFAVAQIAFGDQTGFLGNQGGRGLEFEAVGATPWHLRQLITGTPPPYLARYGTNEIGSGLADAVATALDVAAVLALLAAAAWWWFRDRAIRRGRLDLEDPDLARDFVFTIVLVFVVTSRVLSPQYLIWLVGLSAIILSTARTRMLRPALLVVGAVVITAGLYDSPANFVVRNLALLIAALDACRILVAALRNGPGNLASERAELSEATPKRLETSVRPALPPGSPNL